MGLLKKAGHHVSKGFKSAKHHVSRGIKSAKNHVCRFTHNALRRTFNVANALCGRRLLNPTLAGISVIPQPKAGGERIQLFQNLMYEQMLRAQNFSYFSQNLNTGIYT